MPDSFDSIIGHVELTIFKSVVQGWLNGYVQKGDISQAQAGVMTAGAEDLLGLVATEVAKSQAKAQQ